METSTLQQTATKLLGVVRVSPKETPYISVLCAGVRHSIIEFKKPGRYRVFFPIPAPKEEQNVIDIQDEDALLEFFHKKGMK